ncbi:hypothetical protein ABBQ32_002977 [Trebouxia sp. C0010 RCD-2024]
MTPSPPLKPPTTPSPSSTPSPTSSFAPAVQTDTFLDKTPAYPDDQGGLTGFTPLGPTLPNQTFRSIAAGQVSDCFYNTDECADAGSQYSSIAQVTYPDDPTPVTLCICQGAGFTLDSLAQAVGQLNTCTGVARLVPSIYQGSHPNALTCTLKKLRVQCDAVLQVPLFLRKTVKSYAAVPGGGGAYTIAAQITIFGSNSEDVFIHESTHAFDGTFQLSDQQAYLQTLYADSCVPDEYAQNNNVECFAQDMVVFLYYLWNPSFFQNPCLGRQIGFVNMLNVPGVQSYKSSVGESCTLSLVTSCSSQLAWRHPVVTDCNIYLRH